VKYLPRKTIFQIQYDPKLIFYDRLYKNEEITKKFPHWQTDKLIVILKDFEKKHSLTITHNNATYESDLFDKNNEEEIILLLISKITNIVDDGTFSRIGLRRFYLIKQEMSFSELVEIINLKLFTTSFQKILFNPIKDSSIIITSNINDYNYRLILGPMHKGEISKFIRYNIDNHIDPDLGKRVKELGNIFSSYPDVALFLDIDYFITEKNLTQESLMKFWNASKKDINLILERIISMIFEEKIKND
jgi:hypothetical protein